MNGHVEIWSGIEGAKYSQRRRDSFGMTNHRRRYKIDFDLAASLGIDRLRYPIPMNEIMPCRGTYRWKQSDKRMKAAARLGISLIVDPMHHISYTQEVFPNGLLDQDFPQIYAEYVCQLARRYPDIVYYTPVNEPLTNALICGQIGAWHPNKKSTYHFIQLLLNQAKAICLVIEGLRSVKGDVKIVHTDPCEYHHAANIDSEQEAIRRNRVRFLLYDLLYGQVTANHPLYEWLLCNGASLCQIDWYTQWAKHNPHPLDYIGLDYYVHCEETVDVTTNRPNRTRCRGFAELFRDYARHLRRIGAESAVIGLGETNIRDESYFGQVTWLKHIMQQCEEVWNDLGFICWYPLFSTDWDSLLTKVKGNRDPQGIFRLDEKRWARYDTPLTEQYRKVAAGSGSRSIPAYILEHTVADYLSGVSHLMGDETHPWQWEHAPGQ